MAISREWELKIKWNVALFYAINKRRNSFLDRFYPVYFHLGKGYTLPLFLILFFVFGDWLPMVHLLLAMLFTGSIVPIMKKNFSHIRPSRLLENVHVLEKVHYRSFPSADAAYSFTIFAVSLYYLALPMMLGLSIGLGVYALLVIYGRLYMGVHFPLDVLTGSGFGFLSGYFGWLLLPLIPLP